MSWAQPRVPSSGSMASLLRVGSEHTSGDPVTLWPCEKSRGGVRWGGSMSDASGRQCPSAHPYLPFLIHLSIFLSNANENVLGIFKNEIARKTQINLERTGIFTIVSLPIGKEAFLSNQMGFLSFLMF